MIGLVSYGLIILLLVVGVWLNPSITLAAVLCLFAIDQWGMLSSPTLRANSAISNLLLGSIILLGFLKAFFMGRIQPVSPNKDPVLFLTIALVAYAIVTCLWSPMGAFGFSYWMDQLPYYIVMVILMPLTLNSHGEVANALRVFQFLGAGLIALFIFFAQWSGRGIAIEGSREVLTLPLALASLAATVFFVALFDSNKKVGLWLIFRLACMGMAVALIFMSGSRGPVIGLVLAAGLLFPVYTNMTNVRGFFGLMALGGVLAGFLYYGYTVLTAGDTRWSREEFTEDFYGRFYAISTVLGEWADGGPVAWLLGIGSSASFLPRLGGIYPHNVPGEILAEEGLIGFVIFISICWITFRYMRWHIQLCKFDPESRAVVAVFGATAVFLFFNSFKTGALVGSSYLFMIFVVIERYFQLRVIRLQEIEALEAMEAELSADESR